jgi:hypothetical protein
MDLQAELNNVYNRVIENERTLLALKENVEALGAPVVDQSAAVSALTARVANLEAPSAVIEELTKRIAAIENMDIQTPAPAPVVETKVFTDGTSATGVAPLPEQSAAQQDAAIPVAEAAPAVEAQHVDDTEFTVDPNSPTIQPTEETP